MYEFCIYIYIYISDTRYEREHLGAELELNGVGARGARLARVNPDVVPILVARLQRDWYFQGLGLFAPTSLVCPAGVQVES